MQTLENRDRILRQAPIEFIHNQKDGLFFGQIFDCCPKFFQYTIKAEVNIEIMTICDFLSSLISCALNCFKDFLYIESSFNRTNFNKTGNDFLQNHLEGCAFIRGDEVGLLVN